MYILLVARGFPTEKYKTNGLFEFDQAKALAKAGCKVVFAAVDTRSIRRWRSWGIKAQEIDGVFVYNINIPGGRLPLSWMMKLASFGLYILYKKIVKHHGRPDIIHAHFFTMAYVAAKLGERESVPLIITEHSSLLNHDKILARHFKIAEEAYRKADLLLCVSPTLAENLHKTFNCEPKYIPNIVDTSKFQYTPRSSGGIFNFVSTGNLLFDKRMDLTIEAFNRAFGACSDVHLTIFGEGIERRKLEELIRDYNLENKITLMGLCSRKTIAEKLMNSDCFVLASRSETFGVAYIEALAVGVPVIATKCGGPEGFIHEGNGVLVPVDDVNALVGAMKYMRKHISHYDRKRIADETETLFSPKTVAKKLVNIYQTITRAD